jgi:two-component system response regulator BaeR
MMGDIEYSVLIAEDDDQIAGVLADYLAQDGFRTQRVADGAAALQAILADAPSVVVLDVMLPLMGGLEVCRAVRASSAVPILMLSACTDEEDRLDGLHAGADDYVCKPFSPREIVARVRAMLRRADPGLRTGAPPQAAGFVLGGPADRVLWDGQPVPFTRVEERLFRTMAAAPRRVFTREALLNAMHQEFRDISERAIDTHIKNVRRKVKLLAPARGFIHAMYGVGYYYEDKPE